MKEQMLRDGRLCGMPLLLPFSVPRLATELTHVNIIKTGAGGGATGPLLLLIVLHQVWNSIRMSYEYTPTHAIGDFPSVPSQNKHIMWFLFTIGIV